MSPVKREITDDDHHPPNKRSKQNEFGGGFNVMGQMQVNPLDEPSPLGLRLRKSPSLLDLIQMRLNSSSNSGYTSKHEGDLVAKCYFAKHKLVWEVLDGGLKNKIEIQWSDIMALKATYPDDGPGTLDIVVIVIVLVRHCLQCPQGLLGKHYEKLIQCDPRLNFLSQQAEVELESPYFEARKSVFDEPNESIEHNLSSEAPSTRELRGTTSSGGQSSSSRSEFYDPAGRPSESLRETPSPSSVMDTSASEEMRIAEMKGLGSWDQMQVPGLHPSMSMSDLVNHIENRITKNRTSGDDHPLSHEEQDSLKILEDISRCLFNDAQYGSSTSDEKSIMSRVDSLCCLLQKDPATLHDSKGEKATDGGNGKRIAGKGIFETTHFVESVTGNNAPEDSPILEDDDKKTPGMPRNDSVGELLLNLPRIASLPQFFFNP
ncbi:hypothetical protein CTI12_AA379950 [Artemisia annua]|uniref:TRF2/HOY1 PH-like domain-containing protein n=1 Tax=Artemisia annua TaxID=35608 RepID=A0A2U1MHF5_ARTAN|nr:hypothetical protein CTI12_AA379950 [Artemisia annua]